MTATFLPPVQKTETMSDVSQNVMLLHFLREMGDVQSYSWKAKCLTDDLCHGLTQSRQMIA